MVSKSIVVAFVVLGVLFGVSPASAQCTGQALAQTLCGNPGGSTAPPSYTQNPVIGGSATVLGEILASASTTARASLNLPQGTPPSSPVNGDLWMTSAGLFYQANGATVGPLVGGGSSSFAATPPLGVTFPLGVVTYALSYGASLTVSGGSLVINPANANIFTVIQTVDLGSGTEPSADTGTGFAVYGAASATARFEATAFGTSGAGFSGRTSLGTRSAPLAVTSGTLLAYFNAHGYDGSVWTGVGASLHFYADGSTWTTSSHPGEGCIATTASGSISSPTDWLCVHQDGGAVLGSATGGDEGAGKLNTQGLFVNGTAVSTGGVSIATAATNDIAYYTASNAIGGIAAAANAVLATNGSSVPSLVTTLPSGLTAPSLTVTTAFTATGLVTNADLVNSSITLGTTAMSLGSAYTTIAGNITWSGVPTYSGLSSGTCSNGVALNATNNLVLVSCPGVASSIQVGLTNVTSGTTLYLLYNNGGVLGNLAATSVVFSVGTLSLAGNLTTSGSYNSTFSMSGAYTYTFPGATSTLAALSVTQSFTAGQGITPYSNGTQSSGGTLTMNFNTNGQYQTATFGAGNLTIANPTMTAGQCGWLALTQDSVGSRTVTWGSDWKWAAGTAPTLSTGASDTDLITFCVISSSVLAGTLAAQNYH